MAYHMASFLRDVGKNTIELGSEDLRYQAQHKLVRLDLACNEIQQINFAAVFQIQIILFRI